MGDTGQCWKTCEYARGNLDQGEKGEHRKLLEAIFNVKTFDWQTELEKAGIHQKYYCLHPELLEILKQGYYRLGEFIQKNGKTIIVVNLFTIDLQERYENAEKGIDPGDIFNDSEGPSEIELMVKRELAMCTHCKFYEQINNKKEARKSQL